MQQILAVFFSIQVNRTKTWLNCCLFVFNLSELYLKSNNFLLFWLRKR